MPLANFVNMEMESTTACLIAVTLEDHWFLKAIFIDLSNLMSGVQNDIHFDLIFTFSAIFAQHYSPTHNGVYIQNVGYCGYLCVNKTGRVYINVMIRSKLTFYLNVQSTDLFTFIVFQDRLGDDCLFSTSTQQHDITDSVKFVSRLRLYFMHFWGCSRSNKTKHFWLRLSDEVC